MEVKETEREPLAKSYLECCLSALTDADCAIAAARWKNAAGRIYYAVFYAVCALLANDGIRLKSHRGAKNLLNQKYVLTGKIDVELAHFYAELESLRDEADYDSFFEATKEDIMYYRPMAEAFVNAAKELLEEK